MKHLLLIFLALSALVCRAAVDTRQGPIDERVRSMQVRNALQPSDAPDLLPPVIDLGTDDRLVFSFDVLSDDRDYLRYELVHCNADWQPSGLVDSEFLDGFNLGDITDYEFSQATTVHYVHYTLTLPNADVAPRLSGNYLLKIYPENDPDDVWAQFRFMVSEQSAGISAGVTSVTDIDYNVAHQQLNLAIDTERSSVIDPYNDITVIISQNGRADNQAVLRQPLRMQGRNVSVYEHQRPLIFTAGNEYRRFETVSTTYPGMGVESISYEEPYYNFTLAADAPRADQMYLYDRTQAGRYVVREYNSDDSDTKADYAIVHFALEMPEIPGADVYIEGDITDRRLDDNARIRYNPDTGRYERSLLLKQGAYNYQYLVVPRGSATGYTAPIEGDKYQTDNEYLITVYARHLGDRYDRLIGTKLIR